MQDKLPKFIPLYFSYNTNNPSLIGNFFTPFELASVILFISLSIVAYQFYIHRTQRLLIFKDVKSSLISAATLALGLVTVILVLKPKSAPLSEQTIVHGSVDKAIASNQITATFPMMDSVMQIPVTDGKFSLQLDLPTEKAIAFSINNQPIIAFTMQANDSVYLTIKKDNEQYKAKISGTIVANQYLSNKMSLLYNDGIYNDWYMSIEPERVFASIKRDQENNMNVIRNAVTPDNYTFSQQKLKQLENISRVTTLKKYQSYLENLKKEKPKEFEQIPQDEYFLALEKSITPEDITAWEKFNGNAFFSSRFNNPEEEIKKDTPIQASNDSTTVDTVTAP